MNQWRKKIIKIVQNKLWKKAAPKIYTFLDISYK